MSQLTETQRATLEIITRKSRQAVAVSKAISYGWLDLQGAEIESLLELSAELSEDIGGYIIEIHGKQYTEATK